MGLIIPEDLITKDANGEDQSLAQEEGYSLFLLYAPVVEVW